MNYFISICFNDINKLFCIKLETLIEYTCFKNLLNIINKIILCLKPVIQLRYACIA